MSTSGSDEEVTWTSLPQEEGASVEEPSTRWPVPSGYSFRRMLGEGGMGAVYLAEDQSLTRSVAIKVISDRISSHRDASERFLREARTMATVEHSHIVRIYSYGEVEGQAYLVMEYVPGKSLAQTLRDGGPLSVEKSLSIVRQTLLALREAWERSSIVHRDIKPSNILLDSRGEVRVADFGLAKTLDSSGEEAGLTLSGSILGTPHYCSPEQARGLGLDFRSDIYSLGIVLYEMLAGKRPFEGKTPLDVLDRQLRQPLPPLSDLRPDVPARVERLLIWMTAKKPEERPRSYPELLDALDELWSSNPSTNLPTMALRALSDSTAPNSSPRHSRALVGVVAVLVAALLSLGGWLLSGPPAPSANAITVLRFESLGGVSSFQRGLAEVLGSELSKVPELRLMSSESVERLFKDQVPWQEIGGKTQVGSVVLGTVKGIKEQVQIVVRLLDTQSGSVLWSESYVRPLVGAESGKSLEFELQEELAQQMAAEIIERLVGAERAEEFRAPLIASVSAPEVPFPVSLERSTTVVTERTDNTLNPAQEMQKTTVLLVAQRLMEAGQTRQAMEQLRQFAQLEPLTLGVLQSFGQAYQGLGLSEEFHAVTEALLELESEDDFLLLSELEPEQLQWLWKQLFPALMSLAHSSDWKVALEQLFATALREASRPFSSLTQEWNSVSALEYLSDVAGPKGPGVPFPQENYELSLQVGENLLGALRQWSPENPRQKVFRVFREPDWGLQEEKILESFGKEGSNAALLKVGKLMELHPQSARPFLTLGRLYLRQDELGKVEKAAHRALTKTEGTSQEAAEASALLALVALEENPEAAEPWIREARAIVEEHAALSNPQEREWAQQQMALLLFLQGDEDEFLRVWRELEPAQRQALSRDPILSYLKGREALPDLPAPSSPPSTQPVEDVRKPN